MYFLVHFHLHELESKSLNDVLVQFMEHYTVCSITGTINKNKSISGLADQTDISESLLQVRYDIIISKVNMNSTIDQPNH